MSVVIPTVLDPLRTTTPAVTDYHVLNAMLAAPDADGNISFDAEKEAVRQYFLTNINLKMRWFHTLKEKLKYLILEGYYSQDLFDQYSNVFVKSLFKRAYDKKFRFRTYKGAKKFYTNYAMRTFDREHYIERYEDRVCMVALELAQGDEQFARDLVDEMMTQRFQPATPTFSNCGKVAAGARVSCYLLGLTDDMQSIGHHAVSSALMLSKNGGGVAICLTDLRGTEAPIKRIKGIGAGLIPVMKLLDDAFSYANQLGSRDGSGAVYISACHPDVFKVLDSKRENADDGVRIKSLSLGLMMPDILYKLCQDDADFYTFEPYDVMRVYGVGLSRIGITKHYQQMVDDPRITKTKHSARALFTEIARIQTESGYPYIINEDVVNAANPIHGYINMSNLCVAPETLLLTDKGEFPIASLQDQTVRVWNGEQWSETTVVKTGVDQALTKVTLSNGRFLWCTDYHKWYLKKDYTSNTTVELRTHELYHAFTLAPWTSPDGTLNSDIYIIDIERGSRQDHTFCVSEPMRHMAVFNGILSGNCVEILQVSTPSQIADDGTYIKVGKDISCNLGSLNAVQCLYGPDFGRTVEIATRGLTSVSLQSNIQSTPSIRYGNQISHAIGLGVMNLHGLFAKEKIFYGSEESLDLTNLFFCALNYYSLLASNKIAMEKGESFHEFGLSDYASGVYFDKYVHQDWQPKTDKVRELFVRTGFHIPTCDEWQALKASVMAHGLFNQYRLAMAPTGSISYINGSTPSIAPIPDKIEARKEGSDGLTYYPAPELTNDNHEYFQNAYEIGYEKVIDVCAAATPHVDQGISMTLYFGPGTTTRTLNTAMIYARSKKIKTIYYTRVRDDEIADGNAAEQGCVACAV